MSSTDIDSDGNDLLSGQATPEAMEVEFTDSGNFSGRSNSGDTSKRDTSKRDTSKRDTSKDATKKKKSDGLYKLVLDLLTFLHSLTLTSPELTAKYNAFQARFAEITTTHNTPTPVSVLEKMKQKLLPKDFLCLDYSFNQIIKNDKSEIINYLKTLKHMLSTNHRRSLFICRDLGLHFNKLHKCVGKDKWAETLFDLEAYFSGTDVYFYQTFAEFVHDYPKFLLVDISIHQFRKDYKRLNDELMNATVEQKQFWKADSNEEIIDLTIDDDDEQGKGGKGNVDQQEKAGKGNVDEQEKKGKRKRKSKRV